MSIIKHYQGYKPYHVQYAEEHPEHDSEAPTEAETNGIILGYVFIITVALVSVLTAVVLGGVI